MEKKSIKNLGEKNAKKTVKGKIENPKNEKKAVPVSGLLDKILRTLKSSLESITPYKEPFSGKEFKNKYDAIIFKTARKESKFTKLFLAVGEIILSNKEGEVKAESIGEKYVASSLPAYELSYFKPSFPSYRIRESKIEAVENDREGGGETKGVLSFKLVKV